MGTEMDIMIREFVCQHCGHTVVVRPELSKDYVPNTCTPCWDKIVEKAMELLALLK